VVGDSSSCKTKLLHRYITQKLPTETLESTVFEHYTALVRFRSVEFTMGIFDTAGAEDYDRLRPLSYPQTDVFIICARIPSLDMFENMGTKWIPEIQHHCPDTPFLIVGIVDQDLTTLNTSLENEEDDPAPRTIAEFSSLGSQLAEQHEKAWKYMDCNLLSQEDTNKVFEQVSCF
ncbi:cell division control protein 42, partial [Lasiosphaeria ovina]